MENMLKYQEIDKAIRKINRDCENGEERKVISKMSQLVKDAQNRSIALENNAKDLLNKYHALKNSYDNTYAKVQKLVEKDAANLSAGEINSIMNEINSLTSQLFNNDKELSALNDKIKSTLKDFENTRNSAVKARNLYKNAKAKYDELNAKYAPMLEEYRKEQAALEKTIDKTLLAKYKEKKHDNIFPVYVPLTGKMCGGCRMELPSKSIDKLKETHMCTCEQCGRIVYQK